MQGTWLMALLSGNPLQRHSEERGAGEGAGEHRLWLGTWVEPAPCF